MSGVIYTNITGVYVFSDKNLVDKHLFTKEELLNDSNPVLKHENAFKENYGFELTSLAKEWMLGFLSEDEQLIKLRETAILLTKRKIAASVKSEQLIIQAVNNIDDLDRAANNLSKRLREWYELYNPEFSRSIESHEKFVELIQQKNKDELLLEVGITKEESMGADFTEENLAPVFSLAKRIQMLYELREEQKTYVDTMMKKELPNVSAVAGEQIGAKLLSIAGSIERMALFPASTIQLLGAEKALFRHMKTGAKPPKFGFIINHPLITKTRPSEKGKAARILADKISIAVKIDYFKGEFRGDDLRQEVERKLS